MRVRCILILCGLGTFCPAVAHAGGAPAQIYNKSISISWSESRDVKFVEGEEKHFVANITYGIYVSSAGRVFSQMERNSRAANTRGRQPRGVSSASSVAPDGSAVRTSNSRYSRSISFQGREMHIDVQFESGARRVSVNFIEGFSGCTAEIIQGKEAGMPGQIMHGLSTRLLVLKSISMSTPTCSVRDGNIFGT